MKERNNDQDLPSLVPRSGIHFTPGVPTEDGWYVVKIQYTDGIGYETVRIINGMPDNDTIILSHAKLPEL